MANLYIFIDESGNFDFSPTGTKHFLMCSYATIQPHQHSAALQELRYKILAQGHEHECFHASEDRQAVRDEVYRIVKSSKNAIYDFVYVEKNKTYPAVQNRKSIYKIVLTTLLKYSFGRLDAQGYKFGKIIVVIDKALPTNEQKDLKSIIKPLLKSTGRSSHLYFFQTKSDPNAQLADYGAWAKFVSLEKNEHRPMTEIKSLVGNDFHMFRRNTKTYY